MRRNRYIFAILAFCLLLACRKETAETGNEGVVGRSISVSVSDSGTKAGNADLETLKSGSFFLYIDQRGTSLDYKVEMFYDRDEDVWVPKSLDGHDVNMLWMDDPQEDYLKTITVAAIFYDTDLSPDEKTGLFSDDYEYVIPSESGCCADILYANSCMAGSISYGPEGEMEISFSHLPGRLEIKPLSDTRIETMTVGGISRSFRWYPHDNRIIPLDGAEFILPVKKGVQTVYAAPGIGGFYVEISPDRWSFSQDILSGKSYFIDLDSGLYHK